MNQIKLVNAKTKFLLDKKKRDIAETQSLNDFKNRMIIHDLIQSDINAIEILNVSIDMSKVYIIVKKMKELYDD